ncbi:MAG: hypothetical protein ACF8R7_09655 [Phycisphaerales bacterium JB039]
MTTSHAHHAPAHPVRLYEEDAEALMDASAFAERVCLLPGGEPGGTRAGERIRILWGQDMLRDLIDGRYRTIICGVNDQDNSHGMIAQLVTLVETSQWREPAVTSYARIFHESAAVHAAGDREPYVLKFDLDRLLVFALLRPKGRDHFTTADLSRGFQTVAKMLRGRRERQPVASVSFLGARSNRLIGPDGQEPAFETVLQTMYEAGFRGDIYPAPQMWSLGNVGAFPTYPFPEGVARMREGSS